MRYLAPLTTVLLSAGPALAGAETSPGLSSSWLKMLAGLALVLGLLYLFYALSRKGLSFLPGARPGAIRIVEVKSLGPRKGLCLVEVRGRELLLGFGSDRIECLASLGEAPRKEDGFAAKLEAAQGEAQP